MWRAGEESSDKKNLSVCVRVSECVRARACVCVFSVMLLLGHINQSTCFNGINTFIPGFIGKRYTYKYVRVCMLRVASIVCVSVRVRARVCV